MIVATDGQRLRLITQPDHARFAAELLRLWCADGLPEHPRREDLLFSVREHDNGWDEADATPRMDRRTGRPLAFADLPSDLRIELWERGVARFAKTRPYAALLILQHSLVLHEGRHGPHWDGFRGRMEDRRRDLLAGVEMEPATVDVDYPWLALADALSLTICDGRWGPFQHRGHRGSLIRENQLELRLTPFPLAGATTFEIPCRYLSDCAYQGDAHLGGELAASRWERISVRVAPG